MARRRARADNDKPSYVPPPFHLAAAAADATTTWALDVHDAGRGRRVFTGILADVERWLDVFAADPGCRCWLFPLETSWERHRFGQLAKRGWTMCGWSRLDGRAEGGDWSQQRADASEELQAQVDEWRREAGGGGGSL